MIPKFKEGDIVKLKIDNQEMIVERYEEDLTSAIMKRIRTQKNTVAELTGRVICNYIQNGNHYRKSYKESSLELIRAID